DRCVSRGARHRAASRPEGDADLRLPERLLAERHRCAVRVPRQAVHAEGPSGEGARGAFVVGWTSPRSPTGPVGTHYSSARSRSLAPGVGVAAVEPAYAREPDDRGWARRLRF